MMAVKWIRYISVPLIISFVILYLCCLIPTNDIPDVELGIPILEDIVPIDKLVHFGMYLGLSGATALNYIYAKRGQVQKGKLILGAFLIPIIYGGIIEIIQWQFCDGRSGDWFDFLADTLGSLAALPIAFCYRNYLLKKCIIK